MSISSFSGTGVAGNYYTTSVTLTKINSDGTKTSSNRNNNWQCIKATNSTPSDNNNSWRRVRTFVTYNSAHDYSGYTDSKYNDYILHSNVLWQVKKKTQVGSGNGGTHGTIQEGESWTLGDICGKKVSSCRLRFQALEEGSTTRAVSYTHLTLPTTD